MEGHIFYNILELIACMYPSLDGRYLQFQWKEKDQGNCLPRNTFWRMSLSRDIRLRNTIIYMYYQDNRAKGSYRIICTCITKTIVQKVPTESYAHVLPRQSCKRFLQNHMHMYYQDNCAKGSYRIICTCITETIVQKVPTESYAHVLQRQSCKRFLQNHMHMYYRDNRAKA